MQVLSLFLALEPQYLKMLEFKVPLLSLVLFGSIVSKSNITHDFVSGIENFYSQKLKVILFSFHCIFLKISPWLLAASTFLVL